MLPTLKEGQEVLTFNWSRPKKGDVVVIKHDDKEMVKRIQKIDGNLRYVMGDNRQESTDSRHFGSINKSQIVGKVIYYPHAKCCPGSKTASRCGCPVNSTGTPVFNRARYCRDPLPFNSRT
ncbi:S26 family signal peptidase [Candidatus Daviesbacteria bacterium]|nr:S26 family signal peptidase [Candidatus Daviesbacteria bacterium]